MYFFALRNNGYDLIVKHGNLEGGIYYLTLAERFGPLDVNANGIREGARVYLIGASFWELNWEQTAAGRHKIEVVTDIAGPGKAGTAALLVDGKEVGKAQLARTVPAAFTACETFDVGIDLGSPVAAAYEARRAFEFKGTIHTVKVSKTGK